MTTATRLVPAASAVHPPVYLSAEELALRWRKTPRTIQRMVSDGKIAPIRINRTPLFDLVDVESYEHAMRGLGPATTSVPALSMKSAIQVVAPRRIRPRVQRTWYTIAIAHTKGGVGKTSTAWYFAREFTLPEVGLRVVLRDLDDQTDGLTTIFHGHGGSNGAPGALFARRLLLTRQPDDVPSLHPDVVLIDTPPFTPATVQLIDHVEMVVIPVLPEYNAVRVLERMLTNVTEAKRLNPLVRVLILPTKFRRSWSVHGEYLTNIHDLGQAFGYEVLPPVAERMSVQLFAMAGRPWRLAAQRVLSLIREDQARG